MRAIKGYLLLGSAVVLCPCHLPLVVALLGGTVLGGLLSGYLLPVSLAATGWFFVAIVLGWRLLHREEADQDCAACVGTAEGGQRGDAAGSWLAEAQR